MIFLGLHFGHDGTACVIEDGHVRSNVLRERIRRRKHAPAVDDEVITLALARAGCGVGDIDAIAVTSTQTFDLILQEAPSLVLRYGTRRCPPVVPSLVRPALAGDPPSAMLNMLRRPDFAECAHPVERELLGEFAGRADVRGLGVWRRFPGDALWPSNRTLEDIGTLDLRHGLDDVRRTHGFHVPMEAELDGRVLPAVFVHHHLAHASSNFFRSPFERAAVFTQDGYLDDVGLDCGGFFYGVGNSVVPLTPHHAALGFFYEEVGQCLNLSKLGAPGKLMGLAPYGIPRFFDPRTTGNAADLRARGLPSDAGLFIAHAVRRMVQSGEDLGAFGQPSRLTESASADLAASAQMLLERSRVEAAKALQALCRSSGLATDALCLSGGVALNCPANTAIAAESGFERVFVEPNCDDGGLAAGAALYLFHHLLDHPRVPFDGPPLPPTGGAATHPFQGGSLINEPAARRALERSRDVTTQPAGDAAAAAARDIAAGRIVAWAQGPSEVGPRALGRRSILADPRRPEMWPHVNAAKRREGWRPFAPAVLASRADRWFEGCPLPSPYMLFVGMVTNGRLPAVTHVDGTARLQTVDESDTLFAGLLSAFETETGVPAVLNTSLNGPGEPIAETAEDALRCLGNLSVDVAYIGPYRVERVHGDREPDVP